MTPALGSNPRNESHDGREYVDESFACPNCGERDMDRLVWIEDDVVTCQNCGTTFDPATGERRDNDVSR